MREAKRSDAMRLAIMQVPETIRRETSFAPSVDAGSLRRGV